MPIHTYVCPAVYVLPVLLCPIASNRRAHALVFECANGMTARMIPRTWSTSLTKTTLLTCAAYHVLTCLLLFYILLLVALCRQHERDPNSSETADAAGSAKPAKTAQIEVQRLVFITRKRILVLDPTATATTATDADGTANADGGIAKAEGVNQQATEQEGFAEPFDATEQQGSQSAIAAADSEIATVKSNHHLTELAKVQLT